MRWGLWIGTGLWFVLLAQEIAAQRPNVDRTLGILVVGGAVLYFLRRSVRALENRLNRRTRLAAKEAFLHAPSSSESRARDMALPYLLRRDEGRIQAYPWAGRLETLIGRLLQEISSGPTPRLRCETAMRGCLHLLRAGRGHWGWADGNRDTRALAAFQKLQDEEILQYLLVLLFLLTALFRLHLLIWGMPSSPFTRSAMARLRGTWIPFCHLEPTPQRFPPALPHEMGGALSSDSGELSGEAVSRLVSWIFEGERKALVQFAAFMVGERDGVPGAGAPHSPIEW